MTYNLLKKSISLFAFLLSIQGKAQSWQWAIQEQFAGESYHACIDPSNNLIHAITYSSGTLTTGAFTLVPVTTGNNCAIIKYNSNGTVAWANSYSLATARGVCNDNNGNIFVTGYYTSTMVVGTTTLNPLNPGSGGTDIFIIKYNNSGNVLWAKNAGGLGSDLGLTIACDPIGNCIIGGRAASGIITVGTTSIGTCNSNESLLIKLDNAGNFLWGNMSIYAGIASVESVCTNSLNEIFVAGAFTSTGAVIGTSTLQTSGLQDIYLAKYNINGTLQWARSVGGGSLDIPYNLRSDQYGYLYLTGNYFSPTFTLGTSNVLTNAGGSDAFLAKLNESNGNVIWSKTFGTPASELGLDIAPYNSGLYMAGGFSGSLTIGSATYIGNSSFDNSFYAQMDANGNVISSFTLNIGGDDWLTIGIDNSCNLLIAGDFYTNIGIVGPFTLTNTGGEIPCVLKYNLANAPNININLTPVCVGGSATLTATGANTFTWNTGVVSNSLVLPAGNTGTYTVSTTNTLGCTTSATQSISYLALPSITVAATKSLVCKGETVTLTAGGASTYTWNTLAQSNTILVSPTVTTNYTVTGTNSNNCIATKTIQIKVNCSDLRDNTNNTVISLFPNPSNEVLSLELPKENLFSRCLLINAFGEKILELEIHQSETVINVSQFARGIYTLLLLDEQQIITTKKLYIE